MSKKRIDLKSNKFQKRAHIIWANYPDKEVLEAIHKQLENIGSYSCMDYIEYRNKQEAPSWGTIHLRFGSWENVIDQLHLSGKDNFRIWSKKPKEIVLRAAADQIKDIGSISNYDYKKLQVGYNVPSFATLSKIFGSWENFVTYVKPYLETVPTNKLRKWTKEEIELLLQGKPVPNRTKNSCQIMLSRISKLSCGCCVKKNNSEIDKHNKN